MVSLNLYAVVSASVVLAVALPGPPQKVLDVQGHRGARGESIENSLHSFAWGLIDGVTTLELDNGLTKDGVVVVWHDEAITADKCKDTAPATAGDPLFPYVGKSIANLTLAQIKTLDCGSIRLPNFPLQLTYPGSKISTLKETFDFVRCVDKKREVKWNIESKVNPVDQTSTRSPEDFAKAQEAAFVSSGYALSKITYQSFDWRTLIAMNKLNRNVPTSALIDASTVADVDSTTGLSPWFAGLDLNSFPGGTLGAKIAQAAKSIGSVTLSPNAGALPGLFTTKEMVDEAHRLGLGVVPWTVNDLNVAETLVTLGVDGIISDYPVLMRRMAIQKGYKVDSEARSEKEVMKCLQKHL
ncbi:PLC-like phosphodiesterase [Coprinopsis sp. MPI-PUGE-AT-0042]|nr:PLC-like phosphodiesterase [Coprinopsis sp. MPI-PUGE-AT-0042]